MLFNSIQFVIFLPIVFFTYWGVPNRYRWILLLIASMYFYLSWGIKFLAVLLIVSAVTYLTAILIENEENSKKRELILTCSIIILVIILFFFKYLNFTISSIEKLLSYFSIEVQSTTLKIMMPIGISFYIFQSIGYLVDVCRKTTNAEKHFGYFLLFTSFFPQIMSGPIGRADKMLPQYKIEHTFSYDNAVYAMKLMMWGFFKKTVIADNLAYRVDLIYNNISNNFGCAFLFASLFYTFTIYCDFSGYTDIARGVAKLLNIELVENFNIPYISSSVKEFWSRWHMSLSSWLRDYIYIPLGGNRNGKLKKDRNIIITFLISGLWHGANWTFVVWGILHGIAQVVENHIRLRLPKTIRIFLVFTFVSYAWIFFRLNTVNDAAYVIRHMFDGISNIRMYVRNGIVSMEFVSVFDFIWHMIVYFIPLFIFDWFNQKCDVIEWTATLSPVLRHSLYILLIIGICLLHSYGEVSFVYFNF